MTLKTGISPTLELNEKCRELEAQGKTIYKLGFGQSPFPPHPCMVEALQQNAHRNEYLPVQGLLELRAEICKYYRKFTVFRKPENVVIAPGSKELLFLLASVADAEFLITTPAWVSYTNQLDLLGKKYHCIETDYKHQYKLQPDQLRAVLARASSTTPKILILNSPNNPTGQIYTRAELGRLAPVLAEFDTIVLSDEIYNELGYSNTFSSIAEIYENTIISNGISKSFDAGGWRFGYFIFPDALRDLQSKVIQLGSETYSCAPTPIQWAMLDIYQLGNTMDEYIAMKNSILKFVGRYIANYLREIDVKVYSPDGAFYLWLDFNDLLGANTLVDLLEATGIALLDGRAFGGTKHTARLAFVDFDSTIDESFWWVEPDEEKMARLFPRMSTALKLLKNWLDTINGATSE